MINILPYILVGVACVALGVALARIWDSEWRGPEGAGRDCLDRRGEAARV